MKSPVFFKTALVVALGQMGVLLPLHAQTAAPLPSAQPAVQANGSLPVIQAPNIMIGPKTGGDEEGESTEPRVLRGTDKLLNIDKSAPVAAGAPVSFVELSAPFGHDSFLLDVPAQDRVIAGFLNQ